MRKLFTLMLLGTLGCTRDHTLSELREEQPEVATARMALRPETGKFSNKALIGTWRLNAEYRDIGYGVGKWDGVEPGQATSVSFDLSGQIRSDHWQFYRFTHFRVAGDTELLLTGPQDTMTVRYWLGEQLEVQFRCRETCRDRFVRE